MRTPHDIGERKESTHSTLLFVVFVVLILSVFLNVWHVLQPKGRVYCSDFGSYADMLDAYNSGELRLDKDVDGVPCEKYLTKTI